MKICLKDGRRRLTVFVPTIFLTSHHLLSFGYWVVKKTSGKYSPEPMPDINAAQLKKLCRELRRIKKQHGHYELVHVQRAESQIVRVIL